MASGGGTTVLVVDDEASIRLLCRVNLELEGHRVLESGTLDEARRNLHEEAVSVVLLDIHVAGRDGRELLEAIRRDWPEVAVVLLTGSADVDSVSGADAVIAKPFAPDDLVRAVAELSGGPTTRV